MTAPNTAPIFTYVGSIGWSTTDDNSGATAGPVKTANTAKDGTGYTTALLTADATNGSFIETIEVHPVGTNVASVLRVWGNNGSTPATAANNYMVCEIGLAATSLTEAAAQLPIVWAVNKALPPGHKLMCTLGTTIAAGVLVTVYGGKY